MTYGYRYTPTAPVLPLDDSHTRDTAIAFVQRRRHWQSCRNNPATVELVIYENGEWRPVPLPPRADRRATFDTRGILIPNTEGDQLRIPPAPRARRR